MQVTLTLPVILNGAVIVLGIFAALGLFFRQKNRQANKFMGLLLLSMSLWMIDNFMRISGIYQNNPGYYFKPIYYSFAFGPLIYFYVRSIVNGQFRFRAKDALHFIPVVLQASLYLFLSTQDYSYKRWFWLEVHSPFTYRLEFDGTFISLLIYVLLSLKLIVDYQKWLKENYSETTLKQLNWLKVILLLMGVLSLQWFVEVIMRDVYDNFYQYNYSVFILGLLTLILAYRAFYQADQQDVEFERDTSQKKESKDLELKDEIIEAIQNRMNQEKDFLNPDLNLKVFAGNCRLPKRTVSQHINQRLNQSFHEYVNQYRVEEFKNRIAEYGDQGLTLEGLAYECGFNSKATFNRIFKKYTGFTPSEFVSKHAQNAS